MIREALDNFQITPNLTENIMHEISRLKPMAPSGSKPFVPWGTIGVSTLVIVFLMLGVGNQYLSRFQKPYSFDATSEMTIDIIETPVVLNLESKPDVRTQLGSTAAPSKNDGAGQQPDEVLFAAAQTDGEDVSVPKQQWIQSNAPSGSAVMTLFPTPEGEIYIVDGGGTINKLPVDGTEWRHVNDLRALTNSGWGGETPMAKWNNTLYIYVSNEKLFASTNGGETWTSVSNRRGGGVVGFVIMDGVFYLAHAYTVFRSADAGKTWIPIVDGLAGEIRSVNTIHNTLFAATTTGFYRFDAGSWHRLQFPVPEAERVGALTGTENTLYVKAGLNTDKLDGDALRQLSRGQKRSWWIFRSTDKGESWTDITPTNAWPIVGHSPPVELAAIGKTLLVIGRSDGAVVRSIDNGDTWTREKTTGITVRSYSVISVVALNESTFYTGGNSGIHRSIDGGKSWERFNPGARSRVANLIASSTNEEQNMPIVLYAATGSEVVKSSDGGKSWSAVNPDVQITEPYREDPPQILNIVESGGILYAKGKTHAEDVRLYRVSQDGNRLRQIQEAPVFHSRTLWNQLSQRRSVTFDLQDKPFVEQLQESTSGATQFFKQLAQGDLRRSGALVRAGFRGAFTVSDDTFYMEYNFKLFRWEPGETEWYDTEMEETAELSGYRMMVGFKLAVSGNTVYVGKRDGHLVVSFDKGNNWLDLTPALPFPVKAYYDMVFVGSTVYVATDAGVVTSSDGKNWRAITDTAGTPIIIGRLAVDGTNVYGVSKTGVYRLENDTWEQVASEIPEKVTSLAVDGDMLYVGTQSSGVFHFNIDE